MPRSGQDTVVLVPGLLGFARFGTAPKAIEYFDEVVERLMEYTGWAREQFEVHSPPPTGALAWRVASLYELVSGLIDSGRTGPIHLVGHSTGGCDIRLLLNDRYTWPGGPDAAQRASMLARIGHAIALSAPLHGTPIARRLRGTMEAAIPALFALSVFGKLGEKVAMHTQVEAATRMVLSAARSGSVQEGLHALVSATVPGDAVSEVIAYLDQIVTDHELIHDLTVFAMNRLNDAIDGGDRKPLRCYVSASPAPTVRHTVLGLTPLHVLQSAIYAFSYLNTCPDPHAEPDELEPFPDGPWIGSPPASSRINDYASDGVVTSSSQTVDGTAAGIVWGDHLDVVGHFASRRFHGVTVFRSAAGFDDARFDALWKSIADDLRAPTPPAGGSAPPSSRRRQPRPQVPA